MLEEGKVEVTCAANGAEALEILKIRTRGDGLHYHGCHDACDGWTAGSKRNPEAFKRENKKKVPES